MSTVQLYCAQCGKRFEKPRNEYNRRVRLLGEDPLIYCSLRCGAEGSKILPTWATKLCACGTTFTTNTEATYCSRECASLYSFTDERREKVLRASEQTRFNKLSEHEHLDRTAGSLRSREWHKYIAMDQELSRFEIVHHFEFPVGPKIFDLALPEIRTLVEFDEPHHYANREIEPDHIKTEWGQRYGWIVERIPAIDLPVPYPVILIQHLIDQHRR